MFDFNASLNDFAPLSPILLSVDLIWEYKRKKLIDAICVLILLSSPNRLSSVSVVLDFNASLNDVAPLTPILFPVDFMRVESVICWWMPFVCWFFCLHQTDRAQWVLCLISMHRSLMLLLFLQCCCLLIWWEWKIVDCWWMTFVCYFFCIYNSDWVLWVLCLISMHHSITMQLFLQCFCLLLSPRTNSWWNLI